MKKYLVYGNNLDQEAAEEQICSECELNCDYDLDWDNTFEPIAVCPKCGWFSYI